MESPAVSSSSSSGPAVSQKPASPPPSVPSKPAKIPPDRKETAAAQYKYKPSDGSTPAQLPVAAATTKSSAAARDTGTAAAQYGAGQLVQTMMRVESTVVCGLTLLAAELYVLRAKERRRDQVEVYDINKYKLQRCLTVPDAGDWFADMTACDHHCCAYIASHSRCIHRLDGKRADFSRWEVNDQPESLSVNARHNVIITCRFGGKIKEFTTHGQIVREIQLPGEVVWPWHAIELTTGQFVLCHGKGTDQAHRVSTVSGDGRNIVHSDSPQPASDTGLSNGPAHLAVDENEFVFVADYYNQQVTVLSPTLDHVAQVVSPRQLRRGPVTLHLDAQRRRLYVAVGEHVQVFSV